VTQDIKKQKSYRWGLTERDMFMTNPSQSYSPTEVNGRMGFNLIGREGYSSTHDTGAGHMVMAQGGSLASSLGNTLQCSRQKCMPLRQAHAVENLDTNYRNINIYTTFLSDS
jgi:hypothetical protein